MKRLFVFFALLIFLTQDLTGQQVAESQYYTYNKEDYNGIGKWFLGREIAHVMGYQGIEWLERAEREKEERVSLLLENMGLTSEDVIADIGAGSGYHVFRMAPEVKKVYAVDVQPEMLAAMEARMLSDEVLNVELVQGGEKEVNLPDESVDKVLMVDVYHEFSYPLEMLKSIKKALKHEGLIYLIEYRAEDVTVPIKKVHKMSEKQAVKEYKAAGFKLVENIDNLPWQHCMIFKKE